MVYSSRRVVARRSWHPRRRSDWRPGTRPAALAHQHQRRRPQVAEAEVSWRPPRVLQWLMAAAEVPWRCSMAVCSTQRTSRLKRLPGKAGGRDGPRVLEEQHLQPWQRRRRSRAASSAGQGAELVALVDSFGFGHRGGGSDKNRTLPLWTLSSLSATVCARVGSVPKLHIIHMTHPHRDEVHLAKTTSGSDGRGACWASSRHCSPTQPKP